MRYLAPCAILLCITAANAETTNADLSSSASTLQNSTAKIQQTTQSVARKLITSLGLTTVSNSELDSISLKAVVMKALGEGKPMSEIHLATNRAVQEVTGKTLVISTRPAVKSVVASSVNALTVDQAKPTGITINPAEASLDPETGNMMATVQPGESIFRLAQRVYGKENGRKYLAIFEANRDRIKNINVVTEGQVLVMP